MASVWNNDEDNLEERLIEMVEDRLALYDVSDASYSNKIIKQRLWREIKAELNLEEKELKKKWDSLRTQYTRYKKLAPSGSGASTLTGRQVWILGSLQFLEPHTRRMPSVSNLSSQETTLTPVGFASSPEESALAPEDSFVAPEMDGRFLASTPRQKQRPSGSLDNSNVTRRSLDNSNVTRGSLDNSNVTEASAASTTAVGRSRKRRQLQDPDPTDMRDEVLKVIQSSLNKANENDPIANYCTALADRMRELSPLDLLELRSNIDGQVNSLLLAAARRAQYNPQTEYIPQTDSQSPYTAHYTTLE